MIDNSPVKTKTPLFKVEVWHHDEKVEESDTGLSVALYSSWRGGVR